MAHLIQLRQRIKAIETIKKITHAMRLISMSAHTRLRNKEILLKEYIQTSRTLFNTIKAACPTAPNARLSPTNHTSDRVLTILVGSQRGLCGSFNSLLFNFFSRSSLKENMFLIAVGKKAIQYTQSNSINTVRIFPDHTSSSTAHIAQEITDLIFTAATPFTRVDMVSNKLKSFFIQKPHLTNLIPYTHTSESALSTPLSQEYHWEQEPSEIFDQLAYLTIETQIQYLLFQSLMAEQAARFISMDNATRNAKNLLEATQLSYNKLRQAKITKELSELTGNI